MFKDWKRAVVHGAWVFIAMAALVSQAAAAEPVKIDIVKFTFAPKELTIAPGTTMVWVNHDETPHTISTGEHGFTSKALDTDDRYEHTFTDEGDVAYFCTVHPFMTGVIHVRKP